MAVGRLECNIRAEARPETQDPTAASSGDLEFREELDLRLGAAWPPLQEGRHIRYLLETNN